MASRSLTRLFFGVCVFAAMSLALAARAAAPASSSADSSTSQNVVVLRIDGEIEPILAEYLVNGIQAAAREHASLVLITMNTPGGLDDSMRSIIQAILQSPVPVVTFVTPTGSRAASAGFFILLSADIAAMSPGTDTGAASPIMEVGGQVVQIDDTLHKKILNEANAYLRSYVSKRGRNVDLAATAVTDAKAFSEKESLDGKLIDIVASSPEDLLSKLDGRTITRFDGSTVQLALSHRCFTPMEMTAREKFLSRIVEPDVFFILLIVGVLGLYTEFTHPGVFAPGVIGGICSLARPLRHAHASCEPDWTASYCACTRFIRIGGEISHPWCARCGRSGFHGSRCVAAGSFAAHRDGRESRSCLGRSAALRGDRDYLDAGRDAVALVETSGGQGRADRGSGRGCRAGRPLTQTGSAGALAWVWCGFTANCGALRLPLARIFRRARGCA